VGIVAPTVRSTEGIARQQHVEPEPIGTLQKILRSIELRSQWSEQMTTEPKTKKVKTPEPEPKFAIRVLATQSKEPTPDEIRQHMQDNPGCKGPKSARVTLINRVEKLQYLSPGVGANTSGTWVDVETVVVVRE
jgi:hypothetical protein